LTACRPRGRLVFKKTGFEQPIDGRIAGSSKRRDAATGDQAASDLKVIRPRLPALPFGFMVISMSCSNTVSIFI
jgi:hypothetical protein